MGLALPPERWEQERSVTFSENLHEAQERASIAEREVERNGVCATRYSLSLTRDFVLF